MTLEPLHYVWWLISRASGVVALVLVSLSVLLGLAMAARVLPAQRRGRAVVRLHEHVALAALTAVVLHGLSPAPGSSRPTCWRCSARASTCAGASGRAGGAGFTA